MKITVADKKVARKKCTRVIFNEKVRENRFIVDKKAEVLEIKVAQQGMSLKKKLL